MGGEGREGDWECGSCSNRNYAFRSLCNRCKQPRLLVDTKTPRDSKWLPRIGDWICSGCSNNNYASRMNCKKCSLPKEEAAMSALAMPGFSLHPRATTHYLSRSQGLKLDFGASQTQTALLSSPSWPYSLHSAQNPNWIFGGVMGNGILGFPKDWREGDWLCSCGFHNYSSREQCKQCNAPMPASTPSATLKASVSNSSSTLGIKRLASDEFVNDWDSKRLNAGNLNYQLSTNGQNQLLVNGNSAALPTGEVNMPALVGKGAKQWREGDWMCTNCNNHNYASRTHCNRCKTQKEASVNPGVL